DFKMASAMATTLDEKDVEIVLSKLSKKLSDETIKEIIEDPILQSLVESKRLKIKWLEELHAKLYLLTRNEENGINLDGRAILGSSNITDRGLTRPGELNTFFDSSENIKKLLEWYKRNWDRGKVLKPEILLNVIINEGARREAIKSGEFIDIDSFGWNLLDAYLFLFWHLLGGVYDIEEVRKIIDKPTGELPIKKHNEEAVLWGYQILDKYGGVILADPVGTGKSFQALGIIALLRSRRNIKKVLFIAPPHLIKGTDDSASHWEKYIRDFFREPERVGSIEEISQSTVLKCKDKNGEFMITLASSYGLSRLSKDELAKKKLADYDVIVIDEVHHFKNIDAKKRKVLNDIIKYHREGKGSNPPTILLTATPIINDVAEILALMSIYTQGDTGDFDVLARLELEKDIIRKFERYHEIINALKKDDLEKDERDKLEKEEREVLEEIRKFLRSAIVMRSRAYIEKKYWKKSVPRPKLKNMSYEYTEEEKELIELIENLNLSYLELAPSTLLFIKKMSIRSGKTKIDMEAEMITLQGIMKILLAKRLESSVFAFLKTLSRMKDTMEYALNLLETETDVTEIAKLLYAKKIGEIQGDEGREAEKLAALGIYEKDEEAKETIDHIALRVGEITADPDKFREVKKGIRDDIDRINSLLSEKIENIITSYKSKDELILDYLKKKEKESKKIIVYSMYVDTIEWLEKFLSKNGIDESKIFKVTGKTKGKSGIIDNFCEEPGFGVMLSTDALSEGVNLEFVDELVNYDIPWTPSTLMQRVGRLWRSGREKEILFYTILPPKELIQAFSTVIEKVEEKLSKIRDVLIQEIKLLKEEEKLTENFEDRVYGNVYMSEEIDLRKLIEELKGEPEMLQNKLMELINTEMINGVLLKDIISKREKEFKITEKEIAHGRILNVAIGEIPIALISFGKKYWFK
ncbi:DEAD/DEAH box helicase family protein, partial [Candidatus Aerophobetes bacterium]|nr:DEAD/DEAH box helicase family protein [Candidatus Aerophobetes bacterium]